jgi:membrane-associated phospholipid phosphatase
LSIFFSYCVKEEITCDEELWGIMDILTLLQQADEYLYTWVNGHLSASWLDGFMQLLRHPYTWIPFYAFLLYWFYKNCRGWFWPILLFSIVTFALTDYISASVLKPYLGRIRPCYNTDLDIRSVIGCGGRYSLPSSHASNHFGLASFWFITIASLTGRKWYWLFGWAFVICYAQVYVGVHYPGDVLFGALFGTLTGMTTARLFYVTVQNWRKKKGIFATRRRTDQYDNRSPRPSI